MDSPAPSLTILYPGNCELLKRRRVTASHSAWQLGAYNAAAWMRRRQSHLAVNAAIYIAAALCEQQHVAHHLLHACPRSASSGEADVPADPEPVERRAA